MSSKMNWSRVRWEDKGWSRYGEAEPPKPKKPAPSRKMGKRKDRAAVPRSELPVVLHMRARHPGRCPACGAGFVRGDSISWYPQKRLAKHRRCV